MLEHTGCFTFDIHQASSTDATMMWMTKRPARMPQNSERFPKKTREPMLPFFVEDQPEPADPSSRVVLQPLVVENFSAKLSEGHKFVHLNQVW